MGYLMMSSAFLFLAPLFNGGKLQLSIRWLFVMSFVLAVGTFVGLTLAGYDIVQFEVLVYHRELDRIDCNGNIDGTPVQEGSAHRPVKE
jgi:hypothetical protein